MLLTYKLIILNLQYRVNINESKTNILDNYKLLNIKILILFKLPIILLNFPFIIPYDLRLNLRIF